MVKGPVMVKAYTRDTTIKKYRDTEKQRYRDRDTTRHRDTGM